MIHIIQTTTALAPEFGGPVRTIPNLSVELAELGNKVTLVYLDVGQRFLPPYTPPHPNLTYISIPVKYQVGLRPLIIPNYKTKLFEISASNDNLVFHDNGIWLPQNRIVSEVASQLGIPLITTTHGMLEPWSMQYGRLRKMVAWHLYQKRNLEKANVLLATSDDELKNLRGLGLKNPIAVIPNGTVIPKLSEMKERPTERERKKLLFLSRIHPKKGLLNLVEAIRVVQPQNWEVIIAGYDEGNHQEQVLNAVHQAGLESIIKFIGPVDDKDKWDLYFNSDLFVLPSFSENFGIVIAEALSAGLPVITTWGTPWRDLVDYQCGWWVEPTVSELAKSLREAINLSDSQRKQMGINGRKLVETKYSWPAIARKMHNVYQWMVNSGQKPDSLLLG